MPIAQLRAGGYPVLEADVARLSVYQRRHIHIHIHIHGTVALGTHRVLRDSETPGPGNKDA